MTIPDIWNGLLQGLGTLLSFFYDLIPNYGVAIILLTVAVRTAMIPLTLKQTRSMQELSKIQPDMQKLRAKHKGDRQKLTEETMKLYKEHGVNPYGGCLPLLLQMPVFFALFQVFQRCGVKVAKGKTCPTDPTGQIGVQIGVGLLPANSALRSAIVGGHAGFLGMNLGFTPMIAYKEVGLVGSIPYFAFVLLMTATTFYQQKQMSSAQSQAGGQMAAQSQMLMRIMPLMLGVFSLNFPVALTVYWVTSNLWTIGQQYFLIQRKRGPVAKTAPEEKASPPLTAIAPPAAAIGNGGAAVKTPKPSSGAGHNPGGASRSRGSRARKKRRRKRR